MTNSNDLLSQLRDIHVPIAPPIPSLWPTVIALIVLALLLFWFAVRWWNKRDPWVIEAVQELDRFKLLPLHLIPLESAKLLKRIATTVDPSPETVKLTGKPWLNYLNQFYDTDFFTNGQGQILDQIYASGDAGMLITSDREKVDFLDHLHRLITQRGVSNSVATTLAIR